MTGKKQRHVHIHIYIYYIFSLHQSQFQFVHVHVCVCVCVCVIFNKMSHIKRLTFIVVDNLSVRPALRVRLRVSLSVAHVTSTQEAGIGATNSMLLLGLDHNDTRFSLATARFMPTLVGLRHYKHDQQSVKPSQMIEMQGIIYISSVN